MSNFSIGEKVVFVEKAFAGQGDLTLNKIYTVTRKQNCMCGIEMIGVAEARRGYARYYCSDCGYKYWYTNWYYSCMFRRLCQGEIMDELLDKFPLEEEKLDGEEKVVEPLKQ